MLRSLYKGEVKKTEGHITEQSDRLIFPMDDLSEKTAIPVAVGKNSTLIPSEKTADNKSKNKETIHGDQFAGLRADYWALEELRIKNQTTPPKAMSSGQPTLSHRDKNTPLIRVEGFVVSSDASEKKPVKQINGNGHHLLFKPVDICEVEQDVSQRMIATTKEYYYLDSFEDESNFCRMMSSPNRNS